MDLRNHLANAAASPPTVPATPSAGYPTNGDPQSAIPATTPGAYWYYQFAEELRNVVVAAGLTPDDEDLTQLVQALDALQLSGGRALHGLELASMSGNSVTVGAGVARADDDSVNLALGTALEKDFSSAWVAGDGNGGLAVGALPTSGTLHVFLIRNDTTGVIDIAGDTSVTGANLPAGWGAKRRILSLITDGSADLIATRQHGDVFSKATSRDYDSASARAIALLALAVPSGIRVVPLGVSRMASPPTNGSGITSAASGDDDSDLVGITTVVQHQNNVSSLPVIVTNTSAQIYLEVLITSGTLLSNYIDINGWIDKRGK